SYSSSDSLMEHLHGLRLIAPAAGKELIELDACLFRVRGRPCAIKALCSRLRRDKRGQIEKLACLQCNELIAGLRGLQNADGRLARRDERTDLGPGGVERLNHPSLDPQCVVVADERVLPARLRVT